MPYKIVGTVTQRDVVECKPDVVVDTYEEALRFSQANMYTIYANMFEKQGRVQEAQESYATYSVWNNLDSNPNRLSHRQPIEALLSEEEPENGKLTIYYGSAHNDCQLWCISLERTE
jgi:hypothetical protein